MDDQDFLARQFEVHRAHLRAVSYRMLGSYSEAEDAVQDAWLRVSRAGVEGVDNLAGWLTTVVARVCLIICVPVSAKTSSMTRYRSRTVTSHPGPRGKPNSRTQSVWRCW